MEVDLIFKENLAMSKYSSPHLLLEERDSEVRLLESDSNSQLYLAEFYFQNFPGELMLRKQVQLLSPKVVCAGKKKNPQEKNGGGEEEKNYPKSFTIRVFSVQAL